MLPLMFACIWYGVPREKINTALLRDLDWPGIIYAMIGLGLLYAGLDQGNRLDWSNNGLVIGLLLSGSLITLAFVSRELWTPRPFLNLRKLLQGNLLLLMLLLSGFRFIILSTAYIIPELSADRAEFSRTAGWQRAALDRVATTVIALPLANLLRHIDGRWILALGQCPHRRRLLDGNGTDQRMGDGRFPAVADPAGDRPVFRADCAARH